MALSRYSVLPNQAIVNTHVDQDLSLANKVLATKQQGYDEGQAFDQQQEGVFGKFAVRNPEIKRRDQLHDEYVSKAQALVNDQYQGDYGAAMPALRKLASGYAGNEFWNRASTALEREKEDYKTRADLRKSGKNVLDFSPGMDRKAIYDQDSGTYADLEYDTQGQGDWVKDRKEALGKIEASGGTGVLRGSGMEGIFRSIETEGVGANDVQRVALANFRGYLTGASGHQEYRQLLQQGYGDKEAQKMVFMNLAGAGENQIHSKSKTSYKTDPFALYNRRKADEAAANQDMLRLPENNTGFSDNPANGAPVLVDGSGRPYTEKAVNEDVYDAMGASGGSGPVTTRDYSQAPAIIKGMRSNLDKMYPPAKGDAPRSDAQVAKLWNTAIETNGSRSYVNQTLPPGTASVINSMRLGDGYKSGKIEGLAGSSVIPLKMGGGGGTPVTLDQWKETVGEIKSAKITGSILRVPGMPAAYRLVVTNKEGKTFEAAVPGPNQETEYKSRIQPLIDAAAGGKENMVEYGNRIYKTTVAPNIGGKGFRESVRTFEKLADGSARPLRLTTTGRDGKTVYQREANGKIKVAPAMSLDELSRHFDAQYIKDNPQLYNTRGYNNPDEKAERYEQTPED